MSGKPPLYDVAPLAAHIQSLHDTGMSFGLIARRANVSTSTILYITKGRTKKCRREKAQRILAVRPRDYDDLAVRPSHGCRRRVQALYRAGHGPDAIASVAGLYTSTISGLANGHHATVDGRTARAVEAAYRVLLPTIGTHRKARARAIQCGWAPAGAWSDIDDPACTPDIADEIPDWRNQRQVAEDRRAEIRHLSSYGIPEDEIADRLDMNPRYVHDLLREIRKQAVAA
ncbi:AraC-like DNA-binding protein [Streptomyces olivoverticillatus]|uniref:AraC-like DNA-binding protein n=1 Tax=Streptomyces olivoverticillatus TaxID=66427 RepID=A0A7W7LNH2_9ACTN|nr:hypothetical protein [Streptomyces olivoverticillatus]MBB4893499.1 AraC-like DNA-binding protein [Streptomyces olivoverticillatus]